MYLSCLLVDIGADPDRPRPGRLWLRNAYRVHQRMCMAFPSSERRQRDAANLAPFAPSDFGDGHVHVARGQSGFLFRVDPQPHGRAALLVLSAAVPDWDYAFGLLPDARDPRTGRPLGNAGHLLAAPPGPPRPLQLTAAPGARFRFRLQANPVFRVRSASVDQAGQPFAPRWAGKRVPVRTSDEALRGWLDRRSASNGFEVEELPICEPGYVYVNKTRDPRGGHRLRSVRYEGILRVTEPAAFEHALAAGIGPAKGFGFGLLSVAPVAPKSDNVPTAP